MGELAGFAARIRSKLTVRPIGARRGGARPDRRRREPRTNEAYNLILKKPSTLDQHASIAVIIKRNLDREEPHAGRIQGDRPTHFCPPRS